MMFAVMPSQVIQTIDELFPHAQKGVGSGQLQASHSSQLLGILNLIKAIPGNLINLPPSDYADLILAMSTIQQHLEIWISRGSSGHMANVKGMDAVTVIRRILVNCPDEHSPTEATEFLFINDDKLRDNIRQDSAAVIRALNNAEWKATTVLAGATIEALLHCRLQEPSPGEAAIQTAVKKLVANKTLSKPPNADRDSWGLNEFINVANELGLIKPDTAIAARLAQNFRNLIHPGRVARCDQTCDRGTAYSAVGALEHVVRDLSQI